MIYSPSAPAPMSLRQGVIAFGLLLALALVLHFPHFGSHTGDPNFDFYLHYHWAKEYAQRFAEGWLYPRWTFFARYGLGEPVFVFYSPLYYLLTALLTLTGLGTWGAMHVVEVLSNAVFGYFIYLTCRHYTSNRLALVAAFAASANPFLVMLHYKFQGFAWASVGYAAHGMLLWSMFRPKASFERGEPTLEVRDLEVAHPSLPGEYKVHKTSFKAYKGEILGIAGLMGAGRTELVEGIFGACPERTRGEVYLDGKKLNIRSPKDAIDNGIVLLTEDRKALGLFLGQSVAFNTTIGALRTVSDNFLGMINHSQEQKLVRDYVKRLNVKTASIETVIGTLSGGNQQKVILGKWLNADPKVFILDEPTRGIDIGAKVEIYKLLNSLVERGVTVIMISSELPEVMGMCDRIMVMCEGRLAADLPREAATKEAIMSYATGSA